MKDALVAKTAASSVGVDEFYYVTAAEFVADNLAGAESRTQFHIYCCAAVGIEVAYGTGN